MAKKKQIPDEHKGAEEINTGTPVKKQFNVIRRKTHRFEKEESDSILEFSDKVDKSINDFLEKKFIECKNPMIFKEEYFDLGTRCIVVTLHTEKIEIY